MEGVVIDTNVFVAAGFNPRSASGQILASVREGRFRLIWNEPNKPLWLKPTRAAIYVQHLLNPGYEGIHSVLRHALVGGGVTAPRGGLGYRETAASGSRSGARVTRRVNPPATSSSRIITSQSAGRTASTGCAPLPAMFCSGSRITTSSG